MERSSLPQFHPAERLQHVFLEGRLQDVVLDEVFRLGIAGLADALRSPSQVIKAMPKLHTGSEQKPIRARLAKGHAHAARVQNSSRSHLSVELHVSVPADHDVRLHPCKHWQQAAFRCIAAEDFRVVARRGVAEQDCTQAFNVELKGAGPTRQQPLVLRLKLLRRPVNYPAKLFGNAAGFNAAHSRQHLAVPIAVDELRWKVQIEQAFDRSEEHTSELQSPVHLVCRLLLEKKNIKHTTEILR